VCQFSVKKLKGKIKVAQGEYEWLCLWHVMSALDQQFPYVKAR